MNIDPYILSFSAVTVLATIWMGFRSAKTSKTASDFFVAGRSVSVGWNASAISGEYLSAASFMGVAGMVMSSGYDALWYPVCYACGYLFLLLFIAGPLRRFGAYTIPDFAEGRFDSPLFRKIAVVFVLFIGFFYTMPQMKGAGTTLAYIFPGLPYQVGVLLVGAVITLNVALGGMKGITLVQAFQYWAKMFAISVPVFVLMAVYGHYGEQLALNQTRLPHPETIPAYSPTDGTLRKTLPEKAPKDSTWLSPFGPLTTKAAKAAAAAMTNRPAPPAIPLRADLAPEQRVTVSLDSPGVPQVLAIYSELTGRQLLPRTNSVGERMDELLKGTLARWKLGPAPASPDAGLRVHADGLFTAVEVKAAIEAQLRSHGLALVPEGEKGFRVVETGVFDQKSLKSGVSASVPYEKGHVPFEKVQRENERVQPPSGRVQRLNERGHVPFDSVQVPFHSAAVPFDSAVVPFAIAAVPNGSAAVPNERGQVRNDLVQAPGRSGQVRNGSGEVLNDAEPLPNAEIPLPRGFSPLLAAVAPATGDKIPSPDAAPGRNAEKISREGGEGSEGRDGKPASSPTSPPSLPSQTSRELPSSETVAAEKAWLAKHERPLALLYTYSLIIALVCGTAGLPHILVRFYTNPDGVAAKRTTMWVMILIGVFYVFPPVFGVMGRNLLPDLYSGVGSKGTDKVVLELPRILNSKAEGDVPRRGEGSEGKTTPAPSSPPSQPSPPSRDISSGIPWGSILSGVTCAGAFAAFMSTFSGLLVSMTGALAHDVYGRILKPKSTPEQRMRAFKFCAVLIGGVAITLGCFVEPLEINFMVGQAFAIAAASYFPLLFMSVWWRGMTMKGAATGMLTGGLCALGAVTLTNVSNLALDKGPMGKLFAGFAPMNQFWAAHPLWRILCEQPAIWTVPLAIGLMIVVSKLTRRDVPADVRMKMLVLHAPEKLGLKQEYIQEHQQGH